MKKSSSLLHTEVYVFSDSVLCLGKVNENPQSNMAWEERLTWFKSSPEYRALDKIDGEPVEFEWNIFPGFTTLQRCSKVQVLLSTLSVTPEKITGRIIFMSMFSDISWRSKDNKKECVNSQNLRNFPSRSLGGERGGLATLLCLFVFSHGLPVVCSSPRVQLIPPDFV